MALQKILLACAAGLCAACPRGRAGPTCAEPAWPSCTVEGVAGDCKTPNTCDCFRECDANMFLHADARVCYNVSNPASIEQLAAAQPVLYRPLRSLPAGAPDCGAPCDPEALGQPFVPSDRDRIVLLDRCPNGCSGRGFCFADGRCRCFLVDGSPAEDSATGDSCERSEPPKTCLQNCSGAGACRNGMCDFPGGWSAHCAGPSSAKAKPPLVYVYELPPALNAWQDMSFVRHNIGWMLWQELLIDEHRTLDPWAADYYFIPVFPLGTSFGMGTAMAAFEHVISALPYWNATRGLNHLAVASYDFGFCQIAGLAYFKRIRMISHFGLTKAAQPLPWCFGATGGPSYRQNVDMLVPDTMNMDSKRRTPYLRDGDPWAGRNNTFFFSGSRHGDSRNALLDMGIARPGYVIREGGVNIAEEMLRSVFCGDVGPGGFSNRFTLAMALACVPVFLDEHLPAWTDGLNVDEFAVRLDSLQNLTRTLDAVTPHRLLSLREAGRDVWRLFVWPFLMDVGEHNALSMFFRRLAQLAA